mmetsp:Transcript_29368/g.68596  ORF Transcript_29368/g.68596 Transcript_29368/m.68596 type:complete len:88 (+) Transcript_29368:277-540(+)
MVQTTSNALSRNCSSASSASATSASPDGFLLKSRHTSKSAAKKKSSHASKIGLTTTAHAEDERIVARDFEVVDCYGLSELAFHIEMD